MDTISETITDTTNKMIDINNALGVIQKNYTENNNNDDNSVNINRIKSNIQRLQEHEIILNTVVPLSKSGGTAKILKNNFKHLYNKQYTKNATLIVGILLVSGIIIKMSFYETIDYPRVL